MAGSIVKNKQWSASHTENKGGYCKAKRWKTCTSDRIPEMLKVITETWKRCLSQTYSSSSMESWNNPWKMETKHNSEASEERTSHKIMQMEESYITKQVS